jgi:hypothetical protein
MIFVVCSKTIWAGITGGLTSKASAPGNIDHIQERTINWKCDDVSVKWTNSSE